MWISGGPLLAALRRRRRSVLATLLPALFLSVAMGSSCLAMTIGHGTVASHSHATPAPTGHMGHMDHHEAVAPTHAPSQPLCPHCETADQVTATSHAACGAADIAAAGNAAAQHWATDAKQMLAAVWVPLPSTPAPPLIHAASPPYVSTTPSVPLHIRHCVLLI